MRHGEQSETVARRRPQSGGAPDLLQQAVAHVGHTIIHDKRAGIVTGLWIFGLLAVFVLPAPVHITESKLAAYHEKLLPLEQLQRQLNRKQTELLTAEVELNAEQGWFSWFASAKEKERLAPYRQVHDQLLEEVTQLEAQKNRVQRDANRELGLFSAHGVQQAKSHFWKSFERGKVVGKRNTFWDGVFMILGRSRDYDSVLEMLAHLAFYMVVNFSFAMFFMFWIFLFGLPSLIWSFGPSWVESAIFFAIATVGAAAVMMTFVVLLTGASATAVYGMYKLTNGRMRLQGGGSGARRRLQGQHVPGYRPTQVGGEYYYRPMRQSHSHQE